ncbi:hypothetical protein GCM10010343_27050 [Streptomyces avidinii]|uniref:Uncharacterized protein n=1 Tax=Streptomyces avidinii TaxID=1895 RepID=A0ABS4L0D8_STRAV|nr:hypothetical protein [Streptomyces avidinii]GGY99926.1 hypothetical protein GCM10010343_27050 [Streptomyces avidinii]
MTAAVAETNRNSVKSCAESPSSGVASTPASPASPDAIIHAIDDSRSALMPRSSVSERLSTAARSCSPSRVCRISTHSATATRAVTTQVISWSESMPTPSASCQDFAGLGPTPGSPNWFSAGFTGAPASASSSTAHSPAAGSATSSPMVATICAVSPTRASRRNISRSSPQPRPGAKTTTTRKAAGTAGQPSPECNS